MPILSLYRAVRAVLQLPCDYLLTTGCVQIVMMSAAGTLPPHKEKRETALPPAASAGPTGTARDPRLRNALSHTHVTVELEARSLEVNDYEARVP